MASRPRCTTQVVTRGTTNDWYEVAGMRYCSYEVAGTRYHSYEVAGNGARRVSVRGCRVEIQGNNEAVGGEQKDYNTLRSCNMSGGPKRTKIPLPLGGYKTSDAVASLGVS
ncbi:hypothetical protein Tco_1296278 [Tanacetum coccineum]